MATEVMKPYMSHQVIIEFLVKACQGSEPLTSTTANEIRQSIENAGITFLYRDSITKATY